jgi:hypothetical protein
MDNKFIAQEMVNRLAVYHAHSLANTVGILRHN